MMNNAVDGFFFCGSAKRAPGVREKRGGKRAGGGASRVPHRREGTESGEAWNEKERRCVVEARGESKKRMGYNRKSARENRKTKSAQSKNKESPNQSAGAEIRKSEGAESESARARNQKACNLPTTL